jgi:hypothetical protein
MSRLVHESLAEIPEDRLVDRIITDMLWRREFFQLHGMPRADWYFHRLAALRNANRICCGDPFTQYS